MANFDTLKAQIAALIPDNTEQEITAKDVRDAFGDTIDAINAAKEDEGAIAPAQWGGITGDLEDQTDLKNALDAKYVKPASGIPGSDLDNGVRSDLNKARSAVQPGDLALVASTGSYNDLLGKPTIPAAPGTLDTTATSAQATSSSEALSGSVKLHKISKTGKYSDLSGKPTVPVITLNGSTAGNPSFYAPTTAGTQGQVLVSTGGAPTWQAAPSGGGDVTDVTLGGTSVVDGNGVAVLPAYPVLESLTTAEIDTIWAAA